ncbi:hypothetical protein CHS0354_025482 [Potamilus streckersoni]|uniref:Uncharacterized protein n=1 Tax=Potamilus streckersoni TaxID=2493646 RepID=A0AAE0RRQ6_9BIVA|nr:hypothetical protein CHS0354_025482 [Potamilus streckersoni]
MEKPTFPPLATARLHHHQRQLRHRPLPHVQQVARRETSSGYMKSPEVWKRLWAGSWTTQLQNDTVSTCKCLLLKN